MPNPDPITRKKIDQLLAFPPAFKTPGRNFTKKWAGGGKVLSGMNTFPYPVYKQDVQEFFRLARRPCWSDYDYIHAEAAAMLEDETNLKRC